MDSNFTTTPEAQMPAFTEMSDSEIVAKLGDLEFSRGELEGMFNAVANPAGWKQEISRTLALTNRERVATHVAIEFFTGSRAVIEHVGKTDDGRLICRIRAAGYYQTIGA
ncbi:MAG TPA: hypothetical protein VGM15_03070 [Burkholderiaceae bacterium]|jgi:hypothetical protein